MSCCCSTCGHEGTERFFSRNSRRYIRRFRRRGLERIQRYLADGIASLALEGCSILEIGCGVGSLHLTLLQRGAARAHGIDISEGMIRHARELAETLSLAERTTYVTGDFVAEAAGTSPADIVILDKVVCCYDDLPRLLDASMERSRRLYALSFPRPRLLTQAGFVTLRAVGKLLRWSFVPRWHDWEEMQLAIGRKGFAERFRRDSLFWSVRVFERRSA